MSNIFDMSSGWPPDTIGSGVLREVRVQVASLDAFSGHADRFELRRYVEGISGDIKKITVIHGEETQALAFGETLREMKPHAEVIVPEYGQKVEF